jgi:hypothetical protein
LKPSENFHPPIRYRFKIPSPFRRNSYRRSFDHWSRREHGERHIPLLNYALEPMPGARRCAEASHVRTLQIEHENREIAVPQKKIGRFNRFRGKTTAHPKQSFQCRWLK